LNTSFLHLLPIRLQNMFYQKYKEIYNQFWNWWREFTVTNILSFLLPCTFIYYKTIRLSKLIKAKWIKINWLLLAESTILIIKTKLHIIIIRIKLMPLIQYALGFYLDQQWLLKGQCWSEVVNKVLKLYSRLIPEVKGIYTESEPNNHSMKVV
jgi:hypothetical protein